MRLEAITVSIESAVAEIRLGREGEGYAVNQRLICELESAMGMLDNDQDVRCVLLSLPVPPPDSDNPDGPGTGPGLAFRWLETAALPVIAAIEGACTGTRLELALACDIRIAGETSTFAMPQVREGTMPVMGGTQRLPRLIGSTRAKEMILLGEPVDARTALSRGLVNAVTPAGGACAHAEAMARSIVARGPIGVRFAKEAITRGLDMPLDKALRYETDLTVILQSTADRAEGVRAFLEKRAPEFNGT